MSLRSSVERPYRLALCSGIQLILGRRNSIFILLLRTNVKTVSGKIRYFQCSDRLGAGGYKVERESVDVILRHHRGVVSSQSCIESEKAVFQGVI